MTTDTTSTGMPPIAPSRAALDVTPQQRTAAFDTGHGIGWGFADEGKKQVTATLDAFVATVRDVATKLEGNGAAPIAGFIHQAADRLSDWSATVHARSVEDLVADTRTIVRTNPAIAVGLSLTAGFVLSRLIKVSTGGSIR